MDISIKKGLDLRIAGALPGGTSAPRSVSSREIAVVPDDFTGIVPKVEVKPGDRVAAGTPLLHDKKNPVVKLVSPAAGVVKDVVRGDRRKILRVIVEVDPSDSSVAPVAIPESASRLDIVNALGQAGLLAMMRQRPYDIVPDPAVTPRDIFVTAFDSAPLAFTRSWSAADVAVFEAAVALLSKVTDGSVYISRRDTENIPDIAGATMVNVIGPHPAGLVGTQIAKIKPVNKGETVWTLNADTLYKIGLFAKGLPVDWHVTVAVTGSEVKTPCLATCLPGTPVADLTAGNIRPTSAHIRFISGNILTGKKIAPDGYLEYPYSQICVIPEGDDVDEFMGWASMSPKKMSVNPSFPGHWLKRLFKPDARTLGGRRAMIMSNEYERYIPLDILPEYLLKAINSRNIDNMEQLGIYEIAPEDFALAEYADSSKLPLQSIVREGLDYLRHELE